MNDDMIIKETKVWGQYYNVKNVYKRIRLIKKAELLSAGSYPFIDHYTTYCYKPKKQKGPDKEEQKFILSYAYKYDEEDAQEDKFISKLNEIGLGFHKENCLYRMHDAHKIIIYENILPIELILEKI